MKKCSLVLGVLALFLFASCGGNKWSCKKRYCETPEKGVKVDQNHCIAETFIDKKECNY